ncbi:hypothetical protein K2W90_04390 [Candidatus Babeliales bacterium]|nr:hypothetical protein [Candidatus Babeliales bacterium]
MKKNEIISFFKRYGKKVAGVVLIVMGVVGIFLPFLQGILMILAGLVLLGNSKLADKLFVYKECLLAYLRKKFRR